MTKRILVSGYFGGQGHDRKIDYLERLNDALHDHAAELTLYDLSPDPLKTRLKKIKAPYSVTLARHLPRAADVSGAGAEFRRATEVESAIWNCSANRAGAHVDQFVFHFVRTLRQFAPDLVVFWHQFNGLHYIAREVCDTMGVPVVFAEYGELPGTIALSGDGQMGLSLPAKEPFVFAQRPVDDATAAAVVQYIRRMAAERRTRKPQENADETRATFAAIKERGLPVVFYAGQNDPAAGMVPRWHADAHIHSPFYADTFDALAHLAQLAQERRWALVFKPHPMLAQRHAAQAAERFPKVTIVERGDIFECIDAASVVITVVSQVAYLALIRGKPAVVLGRMALSGSGAAYDIDSREDVGGEIQTAIDRGMTPVHNASRDRHFAQLLEHSLFTMDPDLEPLLARPPSGAAEFLMKYQWLDTPRANARIPFAPTGARLLAVGLRWVLGEFLAPLRRLYKIAAR